LGSELTGASIAGGWRDTPRGNPGRGRVKCVVWDLDDTVWNGVLLEGGQLTPRRRVAEVIRALDSRGILHSVASRNDFDLAMAQLERFGLAEFFLYPQINWRPKSSSVADIATALNIGFDSIAFVDDQPFELEEVAFAHPQVLCIRSDEIDTAAYQWEEFQPRFVTDESRTRRLMYRSSIRRDQAEKESGAVGEDFLATLNMVCTISPAAAEDLERAEELTIRTNQLNSTGRTYSYEELKALRESADHLLLVAELEDRFGPYGKIGLALVDTGQPVWTLRLLLMSCRVMSRGVGTVLLHHVMSRAHDVGARLRAEFVETGRNRMMYVTYRFAGFHEVGRSGDATLLEADLGRIQPPPQHLTVVARG
jgi:FkbH-like protein